MKSLEFCPDGQLGRQVHKVRVVPLNHKAKSNAPLRDSLSQTGGGLTLKLRSA